MYGSLRRAESSWGYYHCVMLRAHKRGRYKSMSYVKALTCRECGKDFPKEALHVCEYCFGPLEVSYDYDAIGKVITRELIESRGPNMWRYRELLPLEGEPTVGAQVGFTPLVKADNLAKVAWR